MALPGILTGAAGRAIDDVLRVRSYAQQAGQVFGSVADDGVTAAAATRRFGELASGDVLRTSINAAKPGLRSAFGSRQAQVSGTLHASLSSSLAAQGNLARDTITASRAQMWGRAGAQGADELLMQVDGILPTLESAARRTAAIRIGLGTLGVAGTIAGAAALANRGDGGGQIIAPGPLHEPGAPDLSSRTYA